MSSYGTVTSSGATLDAALKSVARADEFSSRATESSAPSSEGTTLPAGKQASRGPTVLVVQPAHDWSISYSVQAPQRPSYELHTRGTISSRRRFRGISPGAGEAGTLTAPASSSDVSSRQPTRVDAPSACYSRIRRGRGRLARSRAIARSTSWLLSCNGRFPPQQGEAPELLRRTP